MNPMEPEKKYQIFVSSPKKDLVPERNAAMEAVLRARHIPVAMEMFNASDSGVWELIQQKIDESDFYILILGHRYGTMDEDGLSYTEKEYDYSVSKRIPAFAFLIDKSVPTAEREDDETFEKLRRFKKKIEDKKHVTYWKDAGSLQCHILATISEHFHNRPGWVRGDTIPQDVATTLAELNTAS